MFYTAPTSTYPTWKNPLKAENISPPSIAGPGSLSILTSTYCLVTPRTEGNRRK